MKYADLHIHSTYSDGNLTPEEIINIAIERNVKYISITDHDTLSSQYITKCHYSDINIIPGIEFSTEYEDDIEIHILGYCIDVDNPTLKNVVEKLKASRVKRVESIITKLKDIGINIDINDLCVNSISTLGRSHIAQLLVKKGYSENFKLAFKNYLIEGKAGFVKREKIYYKEVLDIIKKSGGIAVLAHPGDIPRQMELDNLLKRLKCHGLSGVEIYHPSHNNEKINTFYNLAKKHKLIITGGSDCHSISNKNSSLIGQYGVNEIHLNKLLHLDKRYGGKI